MSEFAVAWITGYDICSQRHRYPRVSRVPRVETDTNMPDDLPTLVGDRRELSCQDLCSHVHWNLECSRLA